jgi:hypothetical protein
MTILQGADPAAVLTEGRHAIRQRQAGEQMCDACGPGGGSISRTNQSTRLAISRAKVWVLAA